MAIDPQDDIVQDFLVESREILEGLGEQLVALEQASGDQELLNAVFRGFHTIKGGAGFLGVNELVDVCHHAEDIFNLLRQGDKQMRPDLMDDMLQVLDVVNSMFDRMEAAQEPEPAPEALLQALYRHNQPDAEPPAASADAPSSRDISDQEFEALLDALDGEKAAAEDGNGESGGHGASGQGDEISDDEFEQVLDQLYGTGQPPARGASGGEADAEADEPASAHAADPPAPSGGATGGGQQEAAGHARGDTSVRVETAKLDEIMNLVGELVLVRNRLTNLRGAIGDDRLAHAVGNLEHVTSDLQNSVMKTRMQPVRKIFGRFPRVIRDLARSLEKEVQLSTTGEETDLDKNLVEALADPLVHLIRNAVDHGLESPEERERLGKPRTGNVSLAAEQEGDHILLTIADDGRGMDPNRLREIAVKKGVVDAESARRLDDSECYDLIFAPGFSTTERISDVSGRGVGMDVVKNSISGLSGTIAIESHLGEGTVIRIKVPLTLAIMPTLMVRIAGRKFALPMSVVREIFRLDRGRTNVVDGRRTVMVRQKAMPLFFLEGWLDHVACEAVETANDPVDGRCREDSQVVTVVVGNQTVGFVVDEVIGLEEVVIKPLGSMLHGLPGLAGSTITGDGSIALIVDVPSLVQQRGARL